MCNLMLLADSSCCCMCNTKPCSHVLWNSVAFAWSHKLIWILHIECRKWKACIMPTSRNEAVVTARAAVQWAFLQMLQKVSCLLHFCKKKFCEKITATSSASKASLPSRLQFAVVHSLIPIFSSSWTILSARLKSCNLPCYQNISSGRLVRMQPSSSNSNDSYLQDSPLLPRIFMLNDK